MATGSGCQRAAGAPLGPAVCSGLSRHGTCPDCCPFWSDLRERDLLSTDCGWVISARMALPALGWRLGGQQLPDERSQTLSLPALREEVGTQEREARLC